MTDQQLATLTALADAMAAANVQPEALAALLATGPKLVARETARAELDAAKDALAAAVQAGNATIQAKEAALQAADLALRS
jgi:hypothetical protein